MGFVDKRAYGREIEAVNAGQRFGLDAGVIVDILNASSLLAKPCADIWNRMEQQLGFTSDHTEMFRYLDKLPR